MAEDGPWRVQLLIERQVGYRLEVLKGIFQYAREVGNWICEGSDLVPRALESMQLSKPHGIIAGLWDFELAKQLLDLPLPIVDVFDWHLSLKIARVHLDNAVIGEKAARFFIEKGFKNFAFFGHHSLQFSVERRDAFHRVLSTEGETLHVAPRAFTEGDVWADRSPQPHRERLASWLVSLPKPIAVFCPNDGWGVRLTEACRTVRIDIPSQIAVLGVDNDELLCQLSAPPLSSIATSAERVGYEAAALLDRILHKSKERHRQILIPPAEVVERQSTDAMLVTEPDIAMALRYIASHAMHPLSIDQIAHHVVLPRRTLQRRFKQLVGRTIQEEITRCRIDRAKKLLANSELDVSMIARRCGLESRERLWRTFRIQCGLSPNDYRRKLRVNTRHE